MTMFGVGQVLLQLAGGLSQQQADTLPEAIEMILDQLLEIL